MESPAIKTVPDENVQIRCGFSSYVPPVYNKNDKSSESSTPIIFNSHISSCHVEKNSSADDVNNKPVDLCSKPSAGNSCQHVAGFSIGDDQKPSVPTAESSTFQSNHASSSHSISVEQQHSLVSNMTDDPSAPRNETSTLKTDEIHSRKSSDLGSDILTSKMICILPSSTDGKHSDSDNDGDKSEHIPDSLLPTDISPQFVNADDNSSVSSDETLIPDRDDIPGTSFIEKVPVTNSSDRTTEHPVKSPNIPPPQFSYKEKIPISITNTKPPEPSEQILGFPFCSEEKLSAPHSRNLPTLYDSTLILNHNSYSQMNGLQKKQRRRPKCRPVSCDVCNKSFVQRSNLDRHLLIHTKEKPFSCPLCMKAFSQKSHLDGHLQIHTNEKPFVCEVCNRAFSRKCNLNEHIQTHAGRPFICETCNKSFSEETNLEEHRLTHLKEKRFVCEVCSRAFAKGNSLVRHVLTHTQEKFFSCDRCDKSFARKHSLASHLLTHAEVKPFSCEACDKSFSQRYHLNRHLLSHTRNMSADILQTHTQPISNSNPGSELHPDIFVRLPPVPSVTPEPESEQVTEITISDVYPDIFMQNSIPQNV